MAGLLFLFTRGLCLLMPPVVQEMRQPLKARVLAAR
jgi:hypothetical protein